MFSKSISVQFLAVSILTLAFGSPGADAQTQRPNVLVICADDLGLQLGCYGDKTVPTPNIDALAARGVRFSRAYVAQASCSSSRSAAFTGLYPHQNGQIGLSNRGFRMNRSWANTPTLFKTGGYFSGLIGKIHVGGPPGTISVNLTLPFYTEKTRDHRFIRAKTSEFLSKRGDLPFFLQIDCFDPHRPHLAQVAGLPAKPITADAVTPFSWTDPVGDNFNTEVANYYNCVARLDALVGVILEELQTAGALENTVIVLWGDNGPPFPRAKPTLYENGTRVPLIIAGPGVMGGQVRDELVSMVDLMPTLCAIGEIAVPETDQPARQGRSLVPILRGERPEWRDTICTEMTFHRNLDYMPGRAIRNDRWKLIRNLNPTDSQAGVELYDLDNDPDERRNLAGQAEFAAEQADLEKRLATWRQATDDPLLDADLVRRLATIPLNLSVPVPPYYFPGADPAAAVER